MKPLCLLGVILTLFSVVACDDSTSVGAEQSASLETKARTTLGLNHGWRFRYGEVPGTVIDRDFDDTDWSEVVVPHTWNKVGNYGLEEAPDTNKDQGEGWYRLQFDLPVDGEGRQHFLQFNAVATIAEVWVNGTRVGEHKGAFSAFRFDVTEYVKPGSNLVVVKADNSTPAPGSSTEFILPLGGDYFLFGGIYREVSLVSTDTAHIDLLDHGGPGIYIDTPAVSDESATVNVRSKLRNAGGSTRELTLTTTIFNHEDVPVVSESQPLELEANTQLEKNYTLKVKQPRRWNGRTDPYLYKVAVTLTEGKQVIDQVTQPLGIRTFEFDADRGFILNDKPLQLRGASRHQDREGKGWALTKQDHIEDMTIMAEMGINSVRQAHYQHAQAWTEAANRTGMVVWAELPYTHETSITHDALPAPELVENAKSQLVELIRQNYNHPSIVIWAVGNEVDVGNLVVVRRNRGKGEFAKPRALLESLSELAQREDPTGRVSAYADCCVGTAIARENMENLIGATTVTAFNRYFGWYYGHPSEMGTALDGFHAKYPDQPLGVSEYGAGGAFSQHTDNPEGGPPDPQGRPHPEEYQSWYHEKNWHELKQRRYLFGTWIWNMFDFASGSHSVARAEGDTYNINDKGLVHRDRRQRKDAFYFYKANWSSEPVLHITSRRYVNRAYPVVDVRVYSNAAEASLTVNDKQQGTASCDAGICVWPAVQLSEGENNIKVEATFKGETLTDSVIWSAPDPESGLHIMAGTLAGAVTADGQRYGSDNFFIEGIGKPLVPFLIPNRQPKSIANTDDQVLYQSYREGNFRYELPLPNGQWQVTLHMMEPGTDTSQQRRFDVSANGKSVLQDYDVKAQAGGLFAAVTETFSVDVNDGRLQLVFAGKKGQAIVSAITVTR